MIDFFSRLDKFMNFKGLNDNKITIECGISNGLIGKARKRGSLSQDNISKILYTYPELDANWLLTGKGSMLIERGDIVSEPDPVYGEKKDVSEIETLKKKLDEERERLRQSHKENGVLEYKLDEAQKEIERLKNGRENVAVGTGKC